MSVIVKTIGHIRSPYKEKMATPRQPGLAPSITQTLIFHPPYDRAECFMGLEAGQMIWVMFLFHLNDATDEFRPMVRPPRLGGNKKLGVFATRSPFRPNPIGLSAVKLQAINLENNKISLIVAGGDFVDQTPIIDIRPYLPYTDAHPEALTSFPLPMGHPVEISWAPNIHQILSALDQIQLSEMVQLQFGPAYKNLGIGECWKFLFKNWDIQVKVTRRDLPMGLEISVKEVKEFK